MLFRSRVAADAACVVLHPPHLGEEPIETVGVRDDAAGQGVVEEALRVPEDEDLGAVAGGLAREGDALAELGPVRGLQHCDVLRGVYGDDAEEEVLARVRPCVDVEGIVDAVSRRYDVALRDERGAEDATVRRGEREGRVERPVHRGAGSRFDGGRRRARCGEGEE